MPSDFPPRTVTLPEMLTGGTDHAFRQTIYRFVEAASRLGDCREGFAYEAGLTGNQYLVLMSIANQQGQDGVGIAGVSNHVGLASTHVTTEVGKLVRKNLLHKRPNPEDGRAVLVSLTPAGRELVTRISGTVRIINDLLFQDFSRAELAAMRTISEKLVRNSERALAELRIIHDSPAFALSESLG